MRVVFMSTFSVACCKCLYLGMGDSLNKGRNGDGPSVLVLTWLVNGFLLLH